MILDLSFSHYSENPGLSCGSPLINPRGSRSHRQFERGSNFPQREVEEEMGQLTIDPLELLGLIEGKFHWNRGKDPLEPHMRVDNGFHWNRWGATSTHTSSSGSIILWFHLKLECPRRVKGQVSRVK